MVVSFLENGVEGIQAFSNAISSTRQPLASSLDYPQRVNDIRRVIANEPIAVTGVRTNDDLSITLDGVYTSNELSSWNIGDLPFYVTV